MVGTEGVEEAVEMSKRSRRIAKGPGGAQLGAGGAVELLVL